MGAVAFIMAETIGVPYVEIVKAALIPALLYFATAFWMVHLEAGRLRLLGLPKSECPDAWAAVRTNWYLIVPLGRSSSCSSPATRRSSPAPSASR